jgi:nucleoside-diphosphate-sugar epimerase
MVATATAPEINQQIINVGSGHDTSVRELVHLVLEVTGGNPEIVYSPRNERGPARMCADISLARETLGYQPQVSLRQGLAFTLERDGRLRQK